VTSFVVTVLLHAIHVLVHSDARFKVSIDIGQKCINACIDAVTAMFVHSREYPWFGFDPLRRHHFLVLQYVVVTTTQLMAALATLS
jgi:hypothetical protein